MPFGKAISLTRAHTNLLLSEEAAILTGWAACQVWCAQQNTTKIGLVLSNVEDLSGSVASALGSDVVDQLVHHNKFEQDGVTTLLLTEKTTGNETASVLLLLSIPPERLSTITDHPHVDACVFIPRTEEDLEAYLRLYPKSAKVELKDVDDSQQPAMTPEHSERVHWYEKHYEVIAHAHPNSDIAPYLSFALQFSNLMLQIILPMHEQDKSFMNGKNFELGWFPTVAGIANHEETFGPTVRKVIDMSGTAPVKGDQEPMRFRFESREEILQSDPTDR